MDRARGVLRLPRGSAREHPQREPARRVRSSTRRRGRRGRARARRSERSRGRSMPSVPTAHGPTARPQPRLDRLVPHRLRARSASIACATSTPVSTRRSSAAPRTTVGSSTLTGGRACGRTSASPRTPIRRERASAPLPFSCAGVWWSRPSSSAWPVGCSRPAYTADGRSTAAIASGARPCATCAGATRTSRSGSSMRPRHCATAAPAS